MTTDSGDRRTFEGKDLSVLLDFTIPGDAASISPAVDRVLEVVREVGCADGREEDIDLALREALANAVRYGTGNDPAKQVECCVACDPDRSVVIMVRDPGPGFDPGKIPDPLKGRNVYSHHGRGIYLINQLMDEVRFEKGGTEIHMIKRQKPPGE